MGGGVKGIKDAEEDGEDEGALFALRHHDDMLALIALTLLTAASAHKPRDPSGFLLLSPELERSVAPRDDLPDFIPFSGVDPLPEYDVTSPNVLGLGLDKRQSCGNWGMCSDGGCAPPGSRCCGNRE